MTTRPFSSGLSAKNWDAIQKGVHLSVYRGVQCWKSPFDIALYLQLLSRLKPRTVIEIGTKHGGSALFFADMLTAAGNGARVLSVDIAPRGPFSDPRIDFIQGNALKLNQALPDALLGSLKRPWLVIDDSAHRFDTCKAVLDYFQSRLVSGEYIVVEDGILNQLSGGHYASYKNGPNRAVADFLERHGDRYEVDAALCDLYGYNATYCPNAWLRKK